MMFGFVLLKLYEKVNERKNLTRREEHWLIGVFGERTDLTCGKVLLINIGHFFISCNVRDIFFPKGKT